MDQSLKLRKATAARKRYAAERHEATADRFRREADQLEGTSKFPDVASDGHDHQTEPDRNK